MRRMNRREFSHSVAATAGISLLRHPDAEAGEGTGEARSGSITDVPGVRVGHFTDSRRPTGCTAILFDSEATAGVDYDGSAPDSYLGVLLQPVSPIETIHGCCLRAEGLWGWALCRARSGIWRSERQALTGASRTSAYPSWWGAP
jgi:L-aminopeptidase/D-esterase-like protein